MKTNQNFQLGLLHLAHLLMNADGNLDAREKDILQTISKEEKISAKILSQFERQIQQRKDHEIYKQGLEFINLCNEDEKLCAFVHLYHLVQADKNIHEKELRFMFYAINESKIDFDDIIMSSRLSGNKITC